jgi:YD repeat-containing protein
VTLNIDAHGNATKTWTDAAGRTIRSLDQLDKVTAVTCDAGGNQLTVHDANNVGADMRYDNLGRNTQRTDTFGDVTKTEYDRAGNAIKQIDAKNTLISSMLADAARAQSIASMLQPPSSIRLLASLTDAENQTTDYTYDTRGSKLT